MQTDIRLLVRADDAGSCVSSNMGCLRACTDGIARSVEVMMPGAWVTQAAQLYNPLPKIDVGIHLTLTSEWEGVKWRPLTHAPSLVDRDGFFLPLVSPKVGDNRPSLTKMDWSLDEIANEFKAQIALGTRMFRHATHVSSHMLRHFKDFDRRLGAVIAELCAQFGLKDDAFGHGLARVDGYPKFPRDAQSRIASFADTLSGLGAGTYIFIDHPAVASAELDAIGNPQYDDVAADRVSCLETLTSATLRQCVADRGIQLISYKDL